LDWSAIEVGAGETEEWFDARRCSDALTRFPLETLTGGDPLRRIAAATFVLRRSPAASGPPQAAVPVNVVTPLVPTKSVWANRRSSLS
jgi:hypothetical protein